MKSWIIIIISFALSFAYGVFTQARQKRLETLEANERYTRLSELNHTYSGFTLNKAQRELVNRYSVLYQCLPEPERLRVEAMAHVFMAEVEFVAVGLEAVTEEMRLLVSMEACVLVMNRGFEGYRRLKCVEFRNQPPKNTSGKWVGDCDGKRIRLLWPTLSSAKVFRAQMCGVPYSVILHEFAHLLDQADDGIAQSIPAPQGTAKARSWNDLLDREYPRLEEMHRSAFLPGFKRCNHPVIPRYAVSDSDRSEFFPEATVAFIINPKALQVYSPPLYQQLRLYYGFDPVTWNLKASKVRPGSLPARNKKNLSQS